MSFISFEFLLFIAATLLVYYVVPKRVQWIVLLLASMYFYYTYGLDKIIFVIAAAALAYGFALWIGRLGREKKKRAKPALIIGVILLLGMLLYSKVGAWIVESIGGLFGNSSADIAPVLTSLGISYYTLSLVSYLVDVYRRDIEPEKNFLRIFLFTIYFPKSLQGPVSRYSELGPQFREPHRFDYRTVCFGLQRLIWGYFKKLVIADRAGVIAATVFSNHADYSGAYFVVAALFATVQLYCDFSGCMDIIGGFSECVGIKLEKNFDRPFFSHSAAEFWRRWHMTLGTWFKDYVYMPIIASPGMRKLSKKIRKKHGARAGNALLTVIATLFTWFLTGLWHNMNGQYIIWGLYWGVIICLTTVFAPGIQLINKGLRINTEAESWKAWQAVRTFMLFMVCRIIAASESVAAAFASIGKIFSDFHGHIFFDNSLYELGLDQKNFHLLIVSIGALWLVELLQRKGSLRERVADWNLVFRWAAYILLILAVLVFGMYGPGYDAAAFVYERF